MLLSRDEFRNAVFKRDGFKCVVCGLPAKDAHHLVERRLWPDGGYYLLNGASVCEQHHLLAESTELSCDELRERCGIKEVILPAHLYSDQEYDKWANIILPNGQRLKGELFHDESVQKVIKPVLHLFTDRVKHPRTHHLPFSPGVTNDDRIIESLAGFDGEEVIATLKMDGEQLNWYRDGFHARSIDTQSHPARDWFWSVHRRIGHEIPAGWRITAENLYAIHSIPYQNLPAHLLVYGIWNDKNQCLSWDETLEWAELLEVKTVPVLYRGLWDEEKIRLLHQPFRNGDPCEGFVIRVSRRFSFGEHRKVVAKWVRPGHVTSSSHWKQQAIRVNGLGKAD